MTLLISCTYIYASWRTADLFDGIYMPNHAMKLHYVFRFKTPQLLWLGSHGSSVSSMHFCSFVSRF